VAQVLFIVAQPTPQRTPALDALARDGVDLLALYHDADEDTSRGWGAVVQHHPYRAMPRGRLRSCLFVAREVLRPEVRALACFGYHRPANVLAVLLARLRRAQVITRSDSNWLTEAGRPWWLRRLKRAVLRLIFGRRTRVWTVGTQNDRYWREMGLANRHLIPYGLPAPPVGTPEQGRAVRERFRLGTGPVLLYVGMLEPHKGVDVLLRAFRAVPEPRARLLVVGAGSLGPDVSAAALADPRIVANGPATQAELGGYYAAADVFVLPSRRDAWGLVVNEAQANGLRVVVSDAVGCVTDLVTPSTGWVFASGDARSLADALTRAAAGRPGYRLTPTSPYNAAAAMLADLRILGVRPAGPDGEPAAPGRAAPTGDPAPAHRGY
jgi:glycosyltransferase involved in cell wall biosynthesis